MITTFRNLAVVFAVLAASGLARLPLDERLTGGLRRRGLLQEPLSIETREDLGQTGLAIALGGLRSLIASLLNLRAHVHWENQEWFELEQTYRTIHALQPRTRYYWEVAAWHLISNAYRDYHDKPGVPPGRRRELQKRFFEKGIGFLEEGVRKNPDDWRLWATLGFSHSQPWRPRNDAAAAEAYRRAYQLSGNLQTQRHYLYALSRIPDNRAAAWETAQAVWAAPHNRKFPTVRSTYYALQQWADPPPSRTLGIEEIFGSRRNALLNLADSWHLKEQGFPVYGFRETIEELCREFDVPEEIHPLRHPPRQWMGRHRGAFRDWVRRNR